MRCACYAACAVLYHCRVNSRQTMCSFSRMRSLTYFLADAAQPAGKTNCSLHCA